jgi:hypothetical protein
VQSWEYLQFDDGAGYDEPLALIPLAFPGGDSLSFVRLVIRAPDRPN